MTAKIRLLAGGTALAAGLWFLTAATAAPPALPKESSKKAAQADIASIQALVTDIAAAPDKTKGAARTVKSLSLLLIAYGDEATQGQAAKVLLALDKKDYKAAVEAAKGLSSPKADPAAVKAIEGKYTLEDVMSPFRVSKSGGMNIEKDIRDFKKAGKIDAKDAELIGARTHVIADITSKMPNDKAMTSPAMTMKWVKYSKDMGSAGKDLTDEAAKGEKADAKKLLGALNRLDASCSNCHNDFRNE